MKSWNNALPQTRRQKLDTKAQQAAGVRQCARQFVKKLQFIYY
jgi:hypothetical protein